MEPYETNDAVLIMTDEPSSVEPLRNCLQYSGLSAIVLPLRPLPEVAGGRYRAVVVPQKSMIERELLTCVRHIRHSSPGTLVIVVEHGRTGRPPVQLLLEGVA